MKTGETLIKTYTAQELYERYPNAEFLASFDLSDFHHETVFQAHRKKSKQKIQESVDEKQLHKEPKEVPLSIKKSIVLRQESCDEEKIATRKKPQKNSIEVENPDSALLSRCRVLVLNRLNEDHLGLLLKRAEDDENKILPLTREARKTLLRMADGDGRTLLNFAESLFLYPKAPLLDVHHLIEALQRRAPLYDKAREGHYTLISALHKSIRGSDPNAALYWFCRMVDAGENLLFIARRLVRAASEDIGLTDPKALSLSIAAKEAYEFLDSPEGDLALAQCVIYLALAPKSNAAYVAYKKALQSAKENGSLSPPKHILNAPTALMKGLGYGKGYIYDPDTEAGFSGQTYFPDKMNPQSFYEPKGRGFEEEILKRLRDLNALRKKERKPLKLNSSAS